MFSIPSPLHPAVVHFPIVLLLLGCAVAIVAAFTRRWHLPLLGAVLLMLGAAGAVVSVSTGEREGELVGDTAGSVLDEHEDWAERTRTAALVAAALGIAAVAVGRMPRTARALGACTAIAAAGASWCVVETGHRGGQLVYRHGAGVLAAGGTATNPGADGKAASPARVDRDRDDD